jgi:ABC-2 type transport system permease protein
MTAVMLRKELLEAARDGRLRALVAVLLLLVLAVGASTFQQARSHAQAQSAAQNHEQQRWLEQGDKTPHAAAHYGIYAFRPPGPLAYFDPGLDPYLGVTVWMEAHWQNEPQFPSARDGASFARFGQLTPATTLGVLLPLLIFVFAGPAISTERERGTLRQLLAQGVPGRRLLWGKAAASALLVLALAVPVLAGFALPSLLAGGGVDALLRFGLLAALLLLFLGVMLSLALTVSALAASTRSALGVLLGFWLLGALVMPRLATEWAEVAVPTPGGPAFRQALNSDLEDRTRLDAEIARTEAALLAEFGVDSVEQLPLSINGVRLRLADQAGYEVFDYHFGRLFDGYLEQEQRFQRAGWLSPYVAWNAISAGLSGTDLRHFRHFIDSAEAHRRVIQDMMSAEMIDRPEIDGVPYVADAALWARVPEFSYTPPTFAAVWEHYQTALAALLAWGLAMLVVLEVAGRRLRAS